MPMRPARPCLEPGCRYTTTSGGRCADHRRAREQARGSAASRGYGSEHRRRRSIVLACDPLCVACLAVGRTTPSTVDDHIVPIEAGGAADDLDNQQGLCASCHGKKRHAERVGRQLLVVTGTGFVDVGPLARSLT
jgi:5-methylcytosine-specific restriction protein A